MNQRVNARRIAFAMFIGWCACRASPNAARADAAASGPDSIVASPDSTVADSTLASSTALPWNPSSPTRSAEPWETVVRFPLRVATYPLSLLGNGLERAFRYDEEASFIPRASLMLGGRPRFGLHVMPASLGDRSGLGGAIRYRPPQLGSVLTATVSGSTALYSRTDFDVTWGPAQLAYVYDWRPRERFFDYGMQSSDAVASTYTVGRQQFRLGLAYPWLRRGGTPQRRQLQVWAGPRASILRHGREFPSFDMAFPATAAQLDLRHEYFAYGARASIDTRSGVSHWGRGFRLATQAERFDRSIPAFAIRDAHTDAPPFTRWTAEGEGGTSFMRDPHTLRLAIRAVAHTGDLDDRPLLLSNLVSLGGREGLAGFEPGRFHDADLVVAKLSYIFPLMAHVELDLHTESGGVYSRLGDAGLRTFKRSYGIALRPRSPGPLASFGIDWSAETVRFTYRITGVE